VSWTTLFALLVLSIRKPGRILALDGVNMGRGRRSLLTPELIDEIAEIVRKGNYIQVACACVGISKGTYHLWVKKGEEETARRASVEDDETPEHHQIYVDFLNAVTRARAESEKRAVGLLMDYAEGGDAKSVQFFLERSYRQRWGTKRIEQEVKVEVTELELVVPKPGGLTDED
jgi:hypothetical protein